LSRRGHRLRGHQRSRQPGVEAEGRAAQLRPAGGAEHAAPDHLPFPRDEPEPGDGGLAVATGPDTSGLAKDAHPVPPGDYLVEPGHDFGSVTDKISSIVLQRRTPVGWFVGFAVGFSLFMLLLFTAVGLLFRGIGLWGPNVPVGWGFDIINFVWWIGIGHAGTLISAILLLLRQQWRTSITRAAEAMTLFAVACALLFPIFHTGRPRLAAYWLLPYPNTMGVWPQFRSPLIWDVFAVSTYGTVSALFWFTGLIPDLATMRDRAKSKAGQFIYGALPMGWRGSARHWQIYETAYLILAGLSTPLVLSVHTGESLDFAAELLTRRHR